MRFAVYASVITGASAVLLTGCTSGSSAVDTTPPGNPHTFQELCDYPKPFFGKWFHTDDLRVSTAVGKPLTEHLGDTNQCIFNTADSRYLGYLFFDAPTKLTENKTSTTGKLMVDGVGVEELPDPLPPYMETEKYTPVKLIATIEGWRGEFQFPGGEEQTIQDGAQMLVNTIRALKK
ncbi:hypothetical protein [Nocardia sp. NPDC057030]|uniref:hypothetical protein n=1 Tax=unclassified Nocardia TaxID=2637762 RepID=UPI003627A6F4